MRKPTLNFCIDSAALVAFLFLASTGVLMYLILPAGSGNLSVWSMTRHEWGDIHFWVAVGFVALIAIHFLLHWSWVVGMIRGKSKERYVLNRRILIGIVCLLLILTFALAPLFSPVSESGEISGGTHHGVEPRNRDSFSELIKRKYMVIRTVTDVLIRNVSNLPLLRKLNPELKWPGLIQYDPLLVV